MGEYRHKLTFCLVHDTMDLSAFPGKLDMIAHYLRKAGEPRTAPDGRKQDGVYSRSYCSIQLESFAPDLLGDLKHALEVLQRRKSFLDEFSASGVELRLIVSLYSDINSAHGFEWELLRDLADLKISLDFYFRGLDASHPFEDVA